MDSELATMQGVARALCILAAVLAWLVAKFGWQLSVLGDWGISLLLMFGGFLCAGKLGLGLKDPVLWFAMLAWFVAYFWAATQPPRNP